MARHVQQFRLMPYEHGSISACPSFPSFPALGLSYVDRLALTNKLLVSKMQEVSLAAGVSLIATHRGMLALRAVTTSIEDYQTGIFSVRRGALAETTFRYADE